MYPTKFPYRLGVFKRISKLNEYKHKCIKGVENHLGQFLQTEIFIIFRKIIRLLTMAKIQVVTHRELVVLRMLGIFLQIYLINVYKRFTLSFSDSSSFNVCKFRVIQITTVFITFINDA